MTTALIMDDCFTILKTRWSFNNSTDYGRLFYNSQDKVEFCEFIGMKVKVGFGCITTLSHQCKKGHFQQIQCHSGKSDSCHPNWGCRRLSRGTFEYQDCKQLEKVKCVSYTYYPNSNDIAGQLIVTPTIISEPRT